MIYYAGDCVNSNFRNYALPLLTIWLSQYVKILCSPFSQHYLAQSSVLKLLLQMAMQSMPLHAYFFLL